MLHPARRIVTGHDAEGRAVILSDETSPHVLENPARPGRGLTDLWRTSQTPASNEGDGDAADTQVQLLPPANGSVFRFFQIRPDKEEAAMDPEERMALDAQTFASMGASDEHDFDSGQPGMHKTDTVDYIILLKGEVTMKLDIGEVHMKPMDVVVQRGTNHAWINYGDEPAVLAGILIDAEPV